MTISTLWTVQERLLAIEQISINLMGYVKTDQDKARKYAQLNYFLSCKTPTLLETHRAAIELAMKD